MIKLITKMRMVSSRLAVVLLSALLCNVAAGLLASAALPDGAACPHHASSQECTMAECPMRHAADPPNTADSTVRLVCPTENAFADAMRGKNVHEGAVLWDINYVFDDESLATERAPFWADLTLAPLPPPPVQ